MSKKYDEYLKEHRNNVKKAYNWIEEHLPDIASKYAKYSCYHHDISKNLDDEYKPYDTYFYDNDGSDEIKNEFNKAWLMHIHRNEHHWQHWVLIEDEADGGYIALDMPYRYIIEMICDWWSFSWKSDNLWEIFDWYDDHKDRIMLSDRTRNIVEGILDAIKKELGKNRVWFCVKEK